MKKKSILITYVNNGDFKSTVEQKLMQNHLTNELVGEGKELNMEAYFVHGSVSTFTDGSQIVSAPIDGLEEVRGRQFTHIYISSNLKDMENGMESVKKQIPTLVTGKNEEFNNSGSQVNIFRMENNQIVLNGGDSSPWLNTK